jgi:ribonuclease BN (tRNA processing enzyme)
MANNSITFFGTSDGTAQANFHHTSLLVRLGGATILLDCGAPVDVLLKRANADFNEIDAVVISHLHSDHVGGLAMLIQAMWLEQRTKPLPIYLPRGAVSIFQKWLHACFLFQETFNFRLQLRPIPENRTFSVKGVKIRAFPTTHLEMNRAQFGKKYRRVAFEAYEFLLEKSGKRIGWSGDFGAAADLAPLFREPLDTLVTEMAHCTKESLWEFLSRQNIRQVIFTHVGRTDRANLAEISGRVRKILGSKIVLFASDGDVVEI